MLASCPGESCFMKLAGSAIAGIAVLSLFAATVPVEAPEARAVARRGLLCMSTREAALKTRERPRGMSERAGSNVNSRERRPVAHVERLATFAADLVRLKVNVIVATTHQAAVVARNATRGND